MGANTSLPGCASCFPQCGSQWGELTFAGKPIEAVTAFAIDRERCRELGQQGRELAGERPGRVDHDETAAAERAVFLERDDAELGAENLGNACARAAVPARRARSGS